MGSATMPWEKYSQSDSSAPWEKYSAPPPATPAPPAQQPEKPSGVMDTLGREASSAAGAIAGIPGGIYHAFADPATQEETTEAGGSQEVSGAKRIGLGVGRLTAAPVLNAARWYGDAAQGKIPNAYEQALGVAPEAIGQGAGSVIAGKLAAEAPGAIAKAPIGRIARTGGKLAMGAAEDIPIVRQAAKVGKYWNETAPEPVFSKTRLGPDEAPTGIPLVSKARLGPEPAPPGPPPVFSRVPLGPEAPPPEVGQARGLGGYKPAGGSEALANIPAPAVSPTPPPSNYPPPEPTGRFQIPAPESPNPGRADLLEDQGVQQDMRDYLDKQGRQVHAFEPVGRSKGDMQADFSERNPTASSPRQAAAAPTSADLTPEWQAELDRVKAQKAKKGKR